MHIQPSLRKYGCDCSGEYPVTEWLSENGFYLPSASNLEECDIAYICGVIKDFAR
jgi:perosamine synthetase